MSQFTIIEDCSPYYIRFTHSGIEDLVEYCNGCLPKLQDVNKFKHHAMPANEVVNIMKKTPMSELMPLQLDRVSLFISSPGMYYRAHKDGLDHRFSINYTVMINDDKCVTSWWSDEDLKQYPMDHLNGWSRECAGFNPANHKPLKSMIAKPGECILFNTDIFHDWDNRASSNYRVVLTLRIRQPLTGKTYFEDAKKIIFGY
jgi:hypothetical protein